MWRLIFFSTQSFDEAEALAGMSYGEVITQPRNTGLISSTTRSTGCDWYHRNISLSVRNNAVRFFSFGV